VHQGLGSRCGIGLDGVRARGYSGRPGSGDRIGVGSSPRIGPVRRRAGNIEIVQYRDPASLLPRLGPRQPTGPGVQLWGRCETVPARPRSGRERGHNRGLEPRRLGMVDHRHPLAVGKSEHRCGKYPCRRPTADRARDRGRRSTDRPANVDGTVQVASIPVRSHLGTP
jgi:hypothetical protein